MTSTSGGAAGADQTVAHRPRTFRRSLTLAFQTLNHNWLTRVGAVLGFAYILFALVGPALTPDPLQQSNDILQGPNGTYFFGTDPIGEGHAVACRGRSSGLTPCGDSERDRRAAARSPGGNARRISRGNPLGRDHHEVGGRSAGAAAVRARHVRPGRVRHWRYADWFPDHPRCLEGGGADRHRSDPVLCSRGACRHP